MFGKILFQQTSPPTPTPNSPDLKSLCVGILVLVNVIRRSDVPMPETSMQEALSWYLFNWVA